MRITGQDSELYSWFERPAHIVALAARMLLAAGLFAGLLLKVYMFILTDLRCQDETASLGNAIRCTNALDMVSGTLILAAGLGVAATLFSRSGPNLIEIVSTASCAVAVAFLADLEYTTANWQSATIIASLFAAIGGLTMLVDLGRRRGGSDNDSGDL